MMSPAKTVLIRTQLFSLDTKAHHTIFPRHGRLLQRKLMRANERFVRGNYLRLLFRLGEIDVSAA